MISDQIDCRGLKHQSPPDSSMGAIDGPPRPEKMYILEERVVDAEPTRGAGTSPAIDTSLVEDSVVFSIDQS